VTTADASPVGTCDPVVQIRPAWTRDELEAVYAIREEVFHHEQHLTSLVRDDPDDAYSMNVVATLGGRAVGTGRVTLFGDEAQIAWVAVLPAFRRRGVGRAIMEYLMNWSKAHGARCITLNAQTHALQFYRQLGFEPIGRRFTMGHIEHQLMVLELR